MLIYVVLKAKTPRLHSNIQFLSHLSQPNGEHLLDFNRRVTQTAHDVRELLNGTYERFPNFEKTSQLIDVDANESTDNISNITMNQTNIRHILDQISLTFFPVFLFYLNIACP